MNQRHSSAREDGEGLWDWDLVSNRVHFSPRWISLVGCEDHEIGNTPEEWLERVHPEDRDQVQAELDAARAGTRRDFDFRHRLRRKDGSYRWMSCRAVSVPSEGGQIERLRGSHTDVTVNTVTDSLTGLPNRLLLLDRLTHSIERAQRYKGFHFALLLIDAGQSASPAEPAAPATRDARLTAVARRLETSLRIGDPPPSMRHNDLVARVQDDQFAILLDGLKDVGHTKVVADRMLREILAPFTINGREVFLTASIGVAVSATCYTSAEDMLRDAETALHRARMLGGSHCELFDTAILKSEQAELHLEGELKGALERREFEVFYQPIVSLASNQIVGFEALVRWQHPVLGMVGPQDFIPIAERTGFIVPLGSWILRDACIRLKAWQDTLADAKDVWMSVNVSSVQLAQSAFIDEVREALRHSALEARHLVLELTEGIAMENPTAVKSLLMQLRAMGIRISIDDFGTGYSSLAYLRQFPVDALKVDRSFVRGMETHKATADIVGALMGMAQQLGIKVVAEGIENEQQVTLLRSLRCESAQGYLFAKPLDVQAATELLETGLSPRPETALDEMRASESAMGWRLLFTGRRLAFAAASLALLTTAGLFAGSSPDPLEDSAPEPRATTGTDINLPAAPAAPAAVPVASAATVARRAPSVPPPQSAAPPSQPAAATAQRAPVAPTSTPAAAQSAAFRVVHLHRLGSCQGHLVVSRDGIAFVPESETSEDGFTLRHSEFLPTLEDNRLTIQSANRTFRFRAADGAGGTPIGTVIESLARFR